MQLQANPPRTGVIDSSNQEFEHAEERKDEVLKLSGGAAKSPAAGREGGSDKEDMQTIVANAREREPLEAKCQAIVANEPEDGPHPMNRTVEPAIHTDADRETTTASVGAHMSDAVYDMQHWAGPEVSGLLDFDEQVEPVCTSCWTQLRATDKFCCWCGEAQPHRVLPYMKSCIECQTALPDKANFCYLCGSEVTSGARRRVKTPVELFRDENSEFFPRYEA
ncbi:MAG TPA: zinc ribbon domain-containing protein [Candidatus Obscuribacterales bacterium]